jgi:type II secretory pathway predicted ATPase ExeA
MYENYWQLERRPFETTDDPRFYYPGESHQGTLLKLRYVIENRRGGAVLAGASGTGKTLLVNMLSRQLAEAFRPVAHLVFPQMTAVELLSYLAEEFMAPAGSIGPISAGMDQIIRRLQSFLLDNDAQGRHAVVVIDEAHLLEDVATLEALRLLLNLSAAGKPLLTLLLVGQPRLLPIIDRMPELEERLSIKCLLRPLTLEETVSYVSHRLQAAGAKRPIFEPQALEVLHQLTHGLARRINRLCDLALLIGFAEERRTISAAQLEAVSQELVTVAAD